LEFRDGNTIFLRSFTIADLIREMFRELRYLIYSLALAANAIAEIIESNEYF
jgi:hypothetical protein